MNNLVKRVNSVAFGMRQFRNYRIRALLYADKPNWALLDGLTPPRNPKRRIRSMPATFSCRWFGDISL